jgi:hypothetical protein
MPGKKAEGVSDGQMAGDFAALPNVIAQTPSVFLVRGDPFTEIPATAVA